MSFAVFLTDDAVRDLEGIIDYIERHDTRARAEHVAIKIEAALASLSKAPRRGVYPPELAAVGIRDYREVFFKPYRII